MTEPALHVEQNDCATGLDPALKSTWDELRLSLPSTQALYSFEWTQNWFHHYANSAPWTGASRTLVVRRGTQPVAIIPFAIRQQSRLTILSLAGFYQPLRTWLCTENDAHAAGSAMIQHLSQSASDWDLCRMTPVDCATPARDAFVSGLRAATNGIQDSPLGRTIVHAVKPDLEAYRSSKTFKRVQSYERKFLKQADARVEHFTNPTGDDAKRMLHDLGEIEARSWLARDGGDLRFATPTDHAFWTAHTESAERETTPFNAWIAYLGETAVGFRVVLSSGDIDYMIANQYDDAQRELRLGWVLYLFHLRHAIAEKVRLIDLAPGDLHYKGRLGAEEAEMRKNLLIFPTTLKGRVLYNAIRSANSARGVLEKQAWSRTLAAKIPRI